LTVIERYFPRRFISPHLNHRAGKFSTIVKSYFPNPLLIPTHSNIFGNNLIPMCNKTVALLSKLHYTARLNFINAVSFSEGPHLKGSVYKNSTYSI